MKIEAYTVGYDSVNYHAPIPEGHDAGRVRVVRQESIRNNLLRYLGEYRLGVKFDEFYYQIEDGHLASNERGPVLNKFRNAIRFREERGLSTRREVAECLGFQKLEQKLLNAPDNLLFIWVSPPGLREDGYGLYSFTFIGQVMRDPINNEEKIRVIPYRNILTKEEHRTYLARFTKETENFKSDTDFLANPVVFSQTGETRTPEDILTLIGEHEKISTNWFNKLRQRLEPLINHYLKLVKNGAGEGELTRVKFAMENYTISIKDEILDASDITNERVVTVRELEKTIEMWGRNTPPPVAGSCGASTLMEYHSQDKWEYHSGNCVNCGAKDVEVGPCSICKNCEKEFDNDSTGI